MEIERREALLLLAGGAAGSLLPLPLCAEVADQVYLSARADAAGGYRVTGFSADGARFLDLPLPGRGHSFAVRPGRRAAVHFARRPGRFALVLDLARGAIDRRLNAPADRHFYGHGVFSHNARLLYATRHRPHRPAARHGSLEARRAAGRRPDPAARARSRPGSGRDCAAQGDDRRLPCVQCRRRLGLEGRLRGGLDRDAETTASRQITSALAYAHAAGDIVAIIGRPGRGKTWAPERYCAGSMNAFYLAVSSAEFSLPGLLALVGEAISAGRHHRSALEAERTIIDRLCDRQALIVVNEAHHLRDSCWTSSASSATAPAAAWRWSPTRRSAWHLPAANRWTGASASRSIWRHSPQRMWRISPAGVPGRQSSRAELRTLNGVDRGPGGLHALRRLLGRA